MSDFPRTSGPWIIQQGPHTTGQHCDGHMDVGTDDRGGFCLQTANNSGAALINSGIGPMHAKTFYVRDGEKMVFIIAKTEGIK